MSNEQFGLVSIIVPSYNVEKYIEKCLESIRNQTYSMLEVIIVNDGSTDNTREKCVEFCENDERFKLFDKENGGLSSARNYGLKHALGKYITFVDSDDYLEPTYIEDLYNGLNSNSDCQIAMSKIRWFNEGEELERVKTEYKTKKVDNVSAMKMMMLRKGYSHCAYSKMYDVSFWEGFEFPEGRIYEDYLTTYKLFAKAKKVVLIDRVGYNYLQRHTSIMHMELSEKVLSIIDVASDVTRWISENNPELINDAYVLQAANYLKIYQRIVNAGNTTYSDEKSVVESFLKKHGLSLLLYKSTPNRDRLKIALFMVNKKLFISIYNAISKE